MLTPQIWMTVSEVAEYLGVTGGRVRQMILAGELPATKFGKNWAIARKDVHEFAKIERKPGNPQFLKKAD
jgi:excisionase family DNA binding protein